MQRRRLSLPELAIISGTRAALGAGVGLLLADKLNDERRKGTGWALLVVGVLTTIPIAIQLAYGEKSLVSKERERIPEQARPGRRSDTRGGHYVRQEIG